MYCRRDLLTARCGACRSRWQHRRAREPPTSRAIITVDGEDGLLDPARWRVSTASPDDDRDGEEVGDQRADAEPPRRVGGETEGDPELRHQPKERQADHEDHRIDKELI